MKANGADVIYRDFHTVHCMNFALYWKVKENASYHFSKSDRHWCCVYWSLSSLFSPVTKRRCLWRRRCWKGATVFGKASDHAGLLGISLGVIDLTLSLLVTAGKSRCVEPKCALIFHVREGRKTGGGLVEADESIKPRRSKTEHQGTLVLHAP